MGRYLKSEDFKLTMVILALIGLFLLNACAPQAGMKQTVSDREAPKYQTGKVQGKATKIPKNEPVVEPEQEGDPGAIIPEPSSTVEFDEVNVLVDFDTKKVQIKTNAIVGEIQEALTIEGEFDDSGIAYARSKTKDNQDNALASVRCIKGCSEILTEIAVKHINEDGEEVVEIQQLTRDNLKPAIPGAPSATVASSTAVSSEEELEEGLTNSDNFESDPSVPGEYVSVLKKSDIERLVPVALKPGTVIAPKPDKPTADDGKPTRPDEQKQGDYPFDLKIFPLDLAKNKNYSGEAIGSYASCQKKKQCTPGSLLNSSDIVAFFKNVLNAIAGFLPINFGDSIHYGSGVLVKLIEEVGVDYSQKFPKEKFLVGDISLKMGGIILNKKKELVHASHRNGLDVDIQVSGSGKARNYQKDWELIKMFVSYGLVDKIFFSTENIESICSLIKKTGEKNYEEAFSKLYPRENHTTHFHVRLICTEHNISCQKADYLDKKTPVCK